MRIAASVLTITCLAVWGCALTPSRYLQEAKGNATQHDVVERFGLPYAEHTSSNGFTIWAYRAVGAYLDKDGGHSYCGETILAFDHKKVLQGWSNKGCESQTQSATRLNESSRLIGDSLRLQ